MYRRRPQTVYSILGSFDLRFTAATNSQEALTRKVVCASVPLFMWERGFQQATAVGAMEGGWHPLREAWCSCRSARGWVRRLLVIWHGPAADGAEWHPRIFLAGFQSMAVGFPCMAFIPVRVVDAGACLPGIGRVGRAPAPDGEGLGGEPDLSMIVKIMVPLLLVCGAFLN